jgi:hypothetical protein
MPAGIATAIPVGTVARSPEASEKSSTHARSYAASPARVRAGGRAAG